MTDLHVYTNEQAEADIIANILYRRDCRPKVFDLLDEDDFGDQACRQAFTVLRDAWLQPELSIDSASLRASFAADPKLVWVIQTAVGRSWKDVISEVQLDSLRRRIHGVMLNLGVAINDPNMTAAGAIEVTTDARRKLDIDRTHAPVTIAEIVTEVLDDIKATAAGERQYLSWGFREFDRLAPIYAGNVAVIAARPGVGKTSLAVTSATHQLLAGKTVGYIGLEAPNTDMLIRFSQQLNGLAFKAIKTGLTGCTTGDLERFEQSMDRLSNLPLYLDCGRGMTPAIIQAVVTDWVRNHGVEIVYIDYLQRIKHPAANSKAERVAETSWHIKQMAEDLAIPVVLLAQLNREAAGEAPRMSHLKESGAIEEDAHIVCLIDRPDNDPKGGTSKTRKYTEMNERGYQKPADMEGRAAFLIEKNRNGPSGMFILDYHGPTMRYSESTREVHDAKF